MKKTINLKHIFISAVLLITAVVLCLFAFTSEPCSVGFDNEDAHVFSGEAEVTYAGETISSALPVNLESDKGGMLTIEKTLTADDIKGNSMAFYVRQSWVKVYFDNELYFADNS